MEIRRTQEFDRRLKKLADAKGKARIAIAVQRMRTAISATPNLLAEA